MDHTPSQLWRSMGEALSVFFSSTPGFEASVLESAWMVSTGEPVVDLNCAAIDAGPDASATLQEFSAAMRSRQVPFLICLTEEAAGSLASEAASLDLQHVGPSEVMCLKVTDVQPPAGPKGFELDRVRDQGSLDAVGPMASEIFGLPTESVRHVFSPGLLGRPGIAIYLARVEGEPAGMAVLSLHGSRVGIWCMGTATNFRRRGIGTTLLMRAMRDHLHPDGTTFFLLPTPDGLPLYRRMGFRTVTTGQAWVGGP